MGLDRAAFRWLNLIWLTQATPAVCPLSFRKASGLRLPVILLFPEARRRKSITVTSRKSRAFSKRKADDRRGYDLVNSKILF